jgi:hypothetical protein
MYTNLYCHPFSYRCSHLFYRLVLGDGGDARPFCVSMTSKAMLNVLHKANNCAFDPSYGLHF